MTLSPGPDGTAALSSFGLEQVLYAATMSVNGATATSSSTSYHHDPKKIKQQQASTPATAHSLAPSGQVLRFELPGQGIFSYRQTSGTMKDCSFPAGTCASITDSEGRAYLLGYHQPLSSLFGYALEGTAALNDQKPVLKSFAHEKLTALSASPDGRFLVGGDEQGRLAVWRVSPDGDLVGLVEGAHMQAVTVIRFSSDGQLLVSGGADALVKVWRFEDLLASRCDPTHSLVHTFTTHSLPITGIQFGSTATLAAPGRLLTSSADGSACVFDLFDGQVLGRFVFPGPLSCCAWSADETVILAGSAEGTIYVVDLSPSSGAVAKQALNKHCSRVTALEWTADERVIVSSSEDGLIVFWDSVSRQPIKWHDCAAPVTNLVLRTRMHSAAEDSVRRNAAPLIGPFKRLGNPIVPVEASVSFRSAVVAPVPCEETALLGRLRAENEQLRQMNSQLCSALEQIQ